MADPLRLHVHKRITAVLETITYRDFDGQEYAMTTRVYRGRGVFGNETEVPALSILESPIPDPGKIGPPDATDSAGSWELIIQGFVRDDRRNPTDPAHLLMAQTKQVLVLEKAKLDWDAPEDGPFGLGNVITSMEIGQGVVRPADEISNKAYFWLTLSLGIVEDMKDPFTY